MKDEAKMKQQEEVEFWTGDEIPNLPQGGAAATPHREARRRREAQSSATLLRLVRHQMRLCTVYA
jgi:hypothetical protein